MSMCPSGSLYIVKDKITGQTGEIMHSANDAAIIRTFDRMFSAGKNNFLIRDLELFRFAELQPVEGDFFLLFIISMFLSAFFVVLITTRKEKRLILIDQCF